MIGSTAGEGYAAHIELPEEYPGREELIRDLDDEILTVAEQVVADWKRKDPLLGVMLHPDYHASSWVPYRADQVPAGTEIRYVTHEGHLWQGQTKGPASKHRRFSERSDEELVVTWTSGASSHPFWQPTIYVHTQVDAWVPNPIDLAPLHAEVNTGPAKAAVQPAPAVSWGDLKAGQIIRYEHRNRSQRLAGRPAAIRRARIRDVFPPIPGQRRGQVSILVLNKDGSVRARNAYDSLYELDAIVSIEPATAGE